VTSGQFTAQVGLAEGANVLSVQAQDRAGNVTSRSFVVNRDTGPPVMSVVPADGAPEVEPLQTLIVNVSDALSGVDFASLSITLDGSQVAERFTTAPLQAYLPAGVEELPLGQHVLWAEVADRAGNVAQVQSTFTVTDAGYAPVLSGVEALRQEFCPAENPYDAPERQNLAVRFVASKDVSVSLAVRNGEGRLVREGVYPGLSAGENEIAFDGRAGNGLPLRPGTYSLELVAHDQTGRSSAATTLYVRIHY
jgi:hypothetical protein